MEIERKYLVNSLPDNLADYPYHLIEQGYLNTEPVIRIRRQDEEYILTYKGKGLLAREEVNLPLTADAYAHLREKVDGNIITKKRYCIPYANLTIELDVFDKPFTPLIMAEVEFSSVEESETFQKPEWFGAEVTYNAEYHNSNMSKKILT